MSAIDPVAIPHVVRGVVVEGGMVKHSGSGGSQSFMTPELDLDQLIWPRAEPLPAEDVPISEIIEVLIATGERLRDDTNGLLAAALDILARTSPYERRILENLYSVLWQVFLPERLHAVLDGELGGPQVADDWRAVTGPAGRFGWVRACPTRVVHVLAGNSPGVAAMTVARGAMTKGVHLLKLPSNDLLTATAILRAMDEAAPGHAVTRSFSAVYWRGGDQSVEDALFRPQYFDKVVAWGGEAAIRNVAKYLGPGLELIAFDPKNSISMIGAEAFSSDEELERVVDLAAADATVLNQEACSSSRFQFVEGSPEQVDRYCERLQARLGLERPTTSAVVTPPPQEVRDEVEILGSLGEPYAVFGRADGQGLVVRSEEPVAFFPSAKTVNVVPVPSLDDAIRYVNVSTQTVSIYPMKRQGEMRDRLASAGVQRVVSLGQAHAMIPGFPHDGFYPMHRMVRWVNDER